MTAKIEVVITWKPVPEEVKEKLPGIMGAIGVELIPFVAIESQDESMKKEIEMMSVLVDKITKFLQDSDFSAFVNEANVQMVNISNVKMDCSKCTKVDCDIRDINPADCAETG